MVDRPRPFGFTLPLPRARQNPGNFPVQFRGGKITDAEINASSLRLDSLGHDSDTGAAGSFTNTSYADLDALTGGTALRAVAVTVVTNVRAVVFWRGEVSNSGGATLVSYRVSGATTTAAGDAFALRNDATSLVAGGTFDVVTGLTPGSNTFELQARVSAGTGALRRVEILVLPI